MPYELDIIERLNDELEKIRECGRITTGILAEFYDLDRKTIWRDFRKLQKLGFVKMEKVSLKCGRTTLATATTKKGKVTQQDWPFIKGDV